MRKHIVGVSDHAGLYGHKGWLEARELLIYEDKGLYYLCLENEGVDHSYWAAYMRLCSRIFKMQVFSGRDYVHYSITLTRLWNTVRFLPVVKITIFRFFLTFYENIDC